MKVSVRSNTWSGQSAHSVDVDDITQHLPPTPTLTSSLYFSGETGPLTATLALYLLKTGRGLK